MGSVVSWPNGTEPPYRRKPVSSDSAPDTAVSVSKTDQLVALLSRPDGATIAAMCNLTGWQKQSVRGAMAGSLRKKGFEVTSEIKGGLRHYRIGGDQ